jgi:hypothetical protein
MVKSLVIRPMGSRINQQIDVNQLTINAPQFNYQSDHGSKTKSTTDI